MTSPPDSTSPALPFLTAALPGCGGRIKQRPEDFVVEELPRYAASGEGTHVYLTIEKRGITTPEAVRRIARALGRQPGDLGYAGLKDTQGITRQRISVEHVDPEQARSLQVADVRILEVRRHSNKLRIGHLAGNRFAIRLRDCAADAVTRGSAILDVLARRGVPNYFGPQRFGRRNRNAEVGRAALAGDFADALAWLLGRPRDDDQEAQRRARPLRRRRLSRVRRGLAGGLPRRSPPGPNRGAARRARPGGLEIRGSPAAHAVLLRLPERRVQSRAGRADRGDRPVAGRRRRMEARQRSVLCSPGRRRGAAPLRGL